MIKHATIRLRDKATASPLRACDASTLMSYITRYEAWAALGADPAYKPSRPDAAASPPQLVALNLQQLLELRAQPAASDELLRAQALCRCQQRSE